MKRRVFTLFVCLGMMAVLSGIPVFAENGDGGVLSTIGETRTVTASATEPNYYYYLHCTKDGTADDRVIEIELYVFNKDMGIPNLDGGSFGLRFPARLKTAFKGFTHASGNIEINPMIPVDRIPKSGDEIISDSYHAFSWTIKNDEEYTFTTDDSKGVPNGIRMFLGTYKFELGADEPLPAKSSIGQLDWLKAKESEPSENPGQTAGENQFNRDIWNPDTKMYQGYYQGSNSGDLEDLTLQQTDILLKWTPPSGWPNAFTILSYDPKKQTTAELVEVKNASGSAVNIKIGDTLYLPRWSLQSENDKSGEITAATLNNKGSGVGPYFQALNLDEFGTKDGDITTPAALTPGSTYRLVIHKPGHLPIYIDDLIATSDKLSEAENLPESEVYLPCGDIGPMDQNGTTVFGDGAIKLTDRAYLLAFLNGQLEVREPKNPVAGKNSFTQEEYANPTNPSYLADLNGDGAVTLKDLSILMSPENFNKVKSAS